MSYRPRHAKPSRARRNVRRVVSIGATTGVILTGTCVSANAAPSLPDLGDLVNIPSINGGNIIPEGSSVDSLVPDFSDLGSTQGELDQQTRDTAWQLRNEAHTRADALPAEAAARAHRAIDSALEAVFPGLIAQRTAPAPAPAPAPAAPAEDSFDYGSCPAAARACVDLSGGRTWLQQDGKVTYGAVKMSAGAPSPKTETPKGTHYVTAKVRHEVSHEFNDAPMPYTVYFTSTGVAFHQGDTNVMSHGCIHLSEADAKVFFDQLQVGDMVYVY